MKKVIGWTLLASPFVAVTAFLIYAGGILAALVLWAAVGLVLGVIWAGVYLTTE